MDCNGVQFSRHAIERMFQRALPPEVVESVIANSETVESYPDDTPYPSLLLLGFQDEQPVHVVVAREPASRLCHVITVYRPDPDVWNEDFKTRRKP
ncbi:MAG: DUF4258 domain-containing protein [Deltaproteobacteria bacterium]|nr:DUF4258 domain-containing protein [Deltaproteobacteria bacterium]